MSVFPWHTMLDGIEDGSRCQFLHVMDDFGNLVRVPAWLAVASGATTLEVAA